MSLFVYVHAHTALPAERLHADDASIAGVYAVALDSDVPRDGLAMAALDGFYDQVTIKTPGDFTVTVRQQDGEPVANDGVYENEQLLEYVLSVEKTAEDPIAELGNAD